MKDKVKKNEKNILGTATVVAIVMVSLTYIIKIISILDLIPVPEPPLLICHVHYVKKEGLVLTLLVTHLQISVHDEIYPLKISNPL